MHNAPKPNLEDLPTKAQLRRSSIVAGIGAVAIGVMVYMPAELGKDPTGVGTLLGLTEMGEIKQQLAAEAAADA
ncbi:MAG: transmembrane anchor protein, partial [Pseudomonadota bacterium]|nr:transmembrane anchor protein [Pseudomonadota bacterium]